MSSHPFATKLHELATISRLGGKHALADALDDAVTALNESAALIADFPVLIIQTPGARTVIGASVTASYARKIGDWTRRRDAFLGRMEKP
ncbi:UNVERIFIED_ORG: hypothetical protein LHK14_17655 [Roseateles sp. XES5]|nr:hypothetical protein [Roseateles sp. XES5]